MENWTTKRRWIWQLLLHEMSLFACSKFGPGKDESRWNEKALMAPFLSDGLEVTNFLEIVVDINQLKILCVRCPQLINLGRNLCFSLSLLCALSFAVGILAVLVVYKNNVFFFPITVLYLE
uniref:Uncharacterized protein n=1 Tax=Aegilops tauschii subsp. strangulata TaxID=200361 RepID=A0A453L471_AEGTS